MSTTRNPRPAQRSSLGLVVLWLLFQEPLHVYRMQKLIEHQAMLRRLMGGSPPDQETHKMFLILRLLTLRARRPEPFAGGYEPLVAGVRDGVAGGKLDAPRGRWRDVLRGGERSFGGPVSLSGVLGDEGHAVFERIGSTAFLR